MDTPDDCLIIKPIDLSEIPDDVPDKAWVKIMVELAYGLASEANEHGWNQPHDLLLLNGKRLIESGVTAGAVQPTVVPGFMKMIVEQCEGHPYRAIVHAAYAWERTAAMLPSGAAAAGKQVLGVALVSEGWALFGAEGPQHAGRIADHPQRVETRMIDIALRGNTRISYMQPRDGAPQHLVSQADRPEGYSGSVGDIPNALQFLMQTIVLGHVPMDWSSFEALWDYR